MGFETRDYYRDGSYTDRLTGLGLEFTPVVKYLIIVNVVVFLLQIFITRDAPATNPAQEKYKEIASKMKQKQFEIEAARREVLEAKKAVKESGEDTAGKKKETLAQKEKALKEQEEDLEKTMKEYQREMMENVSDWYGFGQRISIVQEWCELDPNKVRQGQVWRLLTCAFCHDRFGVWHIVFNMVMLYWFGTRLESMYGPREFLLFYFAAALCSSIAYVALALDTGSKAPAIGASGAVMGVVMLYVIYYPFETFLLFWFIPVPLWVMLAGYVIFDLHPVLLALSGVPLFTGVAHAGHLGGLAFGFLYWRFGLRLEALIGKRWERKVWRKPRTRETASSPEPVILSHPKRDEVLADQVDEILRKISEQGKESLTEEERNVLLKASDRLRQK